MSYGVSSKEKKAYFDLSIIGIVGLPGRYGGFETLADQLTQRFGHQCRLQVFCTSRGCKDTPSETYMSARLNYVNWDANGWQSVPYDIVSLWRSAPVSRNLLVLGVSGCLLLPLLRVLWPHTCIVTNIDGLEWKRRKWGRLARWVLRISEWSAVHFSHEVIADNVAIQEHVRQSYGREAKLIAYGGDHALAKESVGTPPTRFINGSYYLGLCRIEPENNVEEILHAFANASDRNLVFVGNWAFSTYSRGLRHKYGAYPNIELKDPLFDSVALASLRLGGRAYVHGHSAGGTNPSLVEAMSLGVAVLAYDVSYNRHTTDGAAAYWSNSDDLIYLLNTIDEASLSRNARAMAQIAALRYTWTHVAEQYWSVLGLSEHSSIQRKNLKEIL